MTLVRVLLRSSACLDNEFTQLSNVFKDLREICNKGSRVSTGPVHRQAKVMEGIGGMLARDAGYDAIVRNSPADTAFSEYVVYRQCDGSAWGDPDADDMPRAG